WDKAGEGIADVRVDPRAGAARCLSGVAQLQHERSRLRSVDEAEHFQQRVALLLVGGLYDDIADEVEAGVLGVGEPAADGARRRRLQADAAHVEVNQRRTA